MFLKDFLTVTALGAVILFAASYVLDSTSRNFVTSSGKQFQTLLIAPFALGNSTAAKSLVTRSPEYLPTYSASSKYHTYRISVRVGRGETLSDILNRIGVSKSDSAKVIRSLRQVFRPSKLRQGQVIHVTFQTNEKILLNPKLTSPGNFLELSLLPDFAHIIVVRKNAEDDFSASYDDRQLTTQLAKASNTIKRSLFMAGKNVKVPDAILGELIRLYSWDVDFQREIRSGDRFELMYEQYYDTRGKLVHNGDIIYGLLELSGKKHPIYRHVTAKGEAEYFDEKGQSTKKKLMRTPIDGARLSSVFGRRKHPILGYTKMHKGIDFAAPRGTPIYAAGNGTIQYAGRKGAYGNFVLIRHNATYSTAYAHLKNISTAKGRRVKQGQIIGHVGTTGRSTGPHLHYEIRRYGRQVNPLKVKLPSGRKLKGPELIAFHSDRMRIEGLYVVSQSLDVALK